MDIKNNRFSAKKQKREEVTLRPTTTNYQLKKMTIKDRFNLEGKVAIITGSSKGIGEAIARGLAEFGAKVVISSRKQEAVDAVAEKFRADGLEATGIACHVGCLLYTSPSPRDS